MNGIYIKAYFGNWKKVDFIQAKQFVQSFYNNITITSDHKKRCEIIEKNHLKGTTVNLLMSL